MGLCGETIYIFLFYFIIFPLRLIKRFSYFINFRVSTAHNRWILPNHPFPLLYYNLLYFRHTFVPPQIYYFLCNKSIHSEIVAQLIPSPTIPYFQRLDSSVRKLIT